MKYIGLNICNKNNLKYYKNIFTSQIINIKNNNICEINSVIIDFSILSTEFIEPINSAKVYYECNVKILYLIEKDDTIYSVEKKIPTIEYINVDKFVDGNIINNLFIKTKTKFELYTDNIYCTIINKNSILLNYYNVIHLKINPAFYIAYYMENGLSNNLFISYADGSNLIQKTFDNFFTYNNIIYNAITSKLLFLGHINNQSIIYHTDTKSKSQLKVNSINNFRNVESFCLYNKNKLLISLINDSTFYIYDINTKKSSKLKTPNITGYYSNIQYDNKYSDIYFIYNITNNPLCKLDKNLNLEILYNENVQDYMVDSTSDKIIIKSCFNKVDVLSIFYRDSKIFNQLNLDFKYDNLIKFDFFYEDDCEYILILYEHNSHNYLIKYNLTTLTYIFMYENYHINDFDIDIKTNYIYICYKDENMCKVISLNNDLEENILKTSNNIKNMFIKK